MSLNLQAGLDWQPDPRWICVDTLDAHTGGEPLRIILAGWPQPPGEDVLARRRYAQAQQDGLRRALMWEPRGHADMYGCLLMPAVRPGSHFAVLFTHNEGYSSMCGHGIIAVVTAVLSTGMLPRDHQGSIRIDSPAGLIEAEAVWDGPQRQSVRQVRFRCVPSWADELDAEIELPGLGRVCYDIGFGGAYYAYVDADALGLDLVPAAARQLIDIGQRIKRAVAARRQPVHPEHTDLGFLYGTIFTGQAHDAAHHSRHVCIFADGELDRSPTGTGVAGRVALLHARGQVAQGETVRIESIVGSVFEGRVAQTLNVHGRAALVPEVAGSAHLSGRHRFFIDPMDPLAGGFCIR